MINQIIEYNNASHHHDRPLEVCPQQHQQRDIGIFWNKVEMNEYIQTDQIHERHQ